MFTKNYLRSISLLSRSTRDILIKKISFPLNKMCSNPFALYIKDNFAEKKGQLGDGTPASEVLKTLSNDWKNSVSRSEKDSYSTKASAASKLNKKGTESYLEGLKSDNDFLIHEAITFDSSLRKGSLSRKDVYSQVKKFVKALPSAPPASGMHLYISEKLKGVKDAPSQMASIQKQWKNLSEYDRSSYEKKAEKGMNQYESDLLNSIKRYSSSS